MVNPGSTNCPGGGGGGGRVAIYYEDNLFTGSIFSHGGRGGYECGGAGTVLQRNLVTKEGQCLFVLEILYITIKYEYFYVVNLQTYCNNNCFCIFMFKFYLQKQRIVKLFSKCIPVIYSI